MNFPTFYAPGSAPFVPTAPCPASLSSASETPANETNSASAIRARTAAALVRYIQELRPSLDKGRLILLEVQDVTEVHGAVTADDLKALGVDTATITVLNTFLTRMIEFMDTSTQSRKSYRSAINAVQRVNAQL